MNPIGYLVDTAKSHPYAAGGIGLIAAYLIFRPTPVQLAPGQKSENVQLAEIQAGVARSQISAQRAVGLADIRVNATTALQGLQSQLAAAKIMQKVDTRTQLQMQSKDADLQTQLQHAYLEAQRQMGLDYYGYADRADKLQADTMKSLAPYTAYQQQWLVRHGFGFSADPSTGMIGNASPYGGGYGGYSGYGGGYQSPSQQGQQWFGQIASFVMQAIAAYFGSSGSGAASAAGAASSGSGAIGGSTSFFG